ncbi:MAG: reductive dehalogenase domain-containing protein, partial [Chloroflexota bacterium]
MRGEILSGRGQLGPYPMEKLKRVPRPTTLVTDDIERADERESGFNRATRGDFGEAVAAARRRPQKDPISGAEAITSRLFIPAADGEVASSIAPLPQNPSILSRHIKRLGYFLRADVVGICRLPPYAVYRYNKAGDPVELDHKYAIVMLVDQDYETINASTGDDWIAEAQPFRGYSNAALIASTMARYIRKLGYPARAQHTGTYQITVPPLLLMAGIGEVSRIGIILNPFLGPRFKASVVTTDLPLEPDMPVDFGL